MKSPYEEKLAGLNTEQLRAVTTTEGPVMVVAGPGTGKTHVLTLRIAQIIKNGTDPHAILALTFTDNAAQNMKDRLISLIGTEAYPVQIQTFHAFCNTVIAAFPQHFTFNERTTVVSELEQLQIIGEILQADTSLELIKPLSGSERNIKSVKSAISEAKREGVTAAGYLQMVEQQWVEPDTIDLEGLNKTKKKNSLSELNKQAKLREIAKVYSQYEEILSKAGRFDYDDLIMSVIDAFSTIPDLLAEYQEALHYILVDEYQDTNTAQNEIVRLLASNPVNEGRPNVFVVGDPHQSIMRFQGASLYNSAEFLTWYPSAEVITLADGYRCTQEIYDLSHQSIKRTVFLQQAQTKIDPKLHVALLTGLRSQQGQAPGSVAYTRAISRDEQFASIATEIKKLIANGVSANEIAVLFKKNQNSDEVAPYLGMLELPYITAADGNALLAPVVKQLLDYITLIYSAGHGNEVEGLAVKVFSYPWLTIDPLLLLKIGRLAGQTKQNVWDLISAVKEWGEGLPLSKEEIAHLAHLRHQQDTMMRLAALEASNNISDWLRLVAEESGLSAYVFEAERMKKHTHILIALQSFMSFVQRSSDSSLRSWGVVELLQAVAVMNEQDIKIPLPADVSSEAVTLSTVHKAKGMEWDYVFVIDVVDGTWGSSRGNNRVMPIPVALQERLLLGEVADTPKERQDLRDDEDRRLFYVAVTRARKQIHLYGFVAQDKFGRTKNASESMFVVEAGLSEAAKNVHSEELTSFTRNTLLVGPRNLGVDGKLESYLGSLVENYHLSVSGLNTYLKSPRDFLTGTLLHIPGPKTESQELGTAMHNLLEKWTKPELDRKNETTRKELAWEIRESVSTILRHHAEQDRWSKKAEDVALAYMEIAQAEKYDNVFDREYGIGRGGRAAVLDGHYLYGKLDRLDWANAEKTAFTVVDYKTGKPKSEGDVLAETESGRKYMSEREFTLPTEIQGDYYRQLLFYKLLGELDSSMKAPISMGQLDFVEAPYRDGKIKQVRFDLSQSHVELLKDLIKEVMQEIKSLSFIEVALLQPIELPPQTTKEE